MMGQHGFCSAVSHDVWIKQALLMAGRIEAAEAESGDLTAGREATYLTAQAAWRSGDVARALQMLKSACSLDGDAGGKLQQLLAQLQPLVAALERSRAAFGEGDNLHVPKNTKFGTRILAHKLCIRFS